MHVALHAHLHRAQCKERRRLGAAGLAAVAAVVAAARPRESALGEPHRVVPAPREAAQVEMRVAVQPPQPRLEVGQVHERVVVHLGNPAHCRALRNQRRRSLPPPKGLRQREHDSVGHVEQQDVSVQRGLRLERACPCLGQPVPADEEAHDHRAADRLPLHP